jgi:hypothetical protein
MWSTIHTWGTLFRILLEHPIPVNQAVCEDLLPVCAMLEIRGKISVFPHSPFVPAGEQEKLRIRQTLTELGVL